MPKIIMRATYVPMGLVRHVHGIAVELRVVLDLPREVLARDGSEREDLGEEVRVLIDLALLEPPQEELVLIHDGDGAIAPSFGDQQELDQAPCPFSDFVTFVALSKRRAGMETRRAMSTRTQCSAV